MSSEHNFSQRVIDENYNKTLRNDLSSEDLNKLRSYFKTALSEMVGQWNNPNVQLSRNALENISKRENEILANINTNHKANNPPNTIFGKLIYYLNRPMSVQIVGGTIATIAGGILLAVILHKYLP